jgi:gas vesicle protein
MRRKHAVHRQNKGGIGKVVTGIVVGSVVGATVGLLMAPSSGAEARRKIKSEVKGIQRRAKDTAAKIEDKGREIIDDARDDIDKVRENIAERVTRRTKSTSS